MIASHLLRRSLWRTRRAAPRTPALVCTAVCPTVKPVGQPDAGPGPSVLWLGHRSWGFRTGMKRRDFIRLIGGAAAWPLPLTAQQPERARRIAVLMGVANDAEGQARAAALMQGLQELGWREGQNLHIEWRWSGG